MEKVKMFRLAHEIDGHILMCHVAGKSKEDVQTTYGKMMNIKKIEQVDVQINIMDVIDGLIGGGLSVAQCDVIVSLIERSFESVAQ